MLSAHTKFGRGNVEFSTRTIVEDNQSLWVVFHIFHIWSSKDSFLRPGAGAGGGKIGPSRLDRKGKFGDPRPVTYEIQDQRSRKRREEGLAGRTGSHPSVALNPWVPQPSLFPVVISLKPNLPIPYSQGLSQPSGRAP